MKRCPGCRRELVWEGRVVAVIDESARWDALIACGGCLAIVCASVKKALWSGTWPSIEHVSLELPGAAAARAIDALRARGESALDRLSRDARARMVLRVPEVAEAARPLFEREARLVRNAMVLAWDWQRTLAASLPRHPLPVVPDLATLEIGRLPHAPPPGLVAFDDLLHLTRARLETLPFRATNQRASARGELAEAEWRLLRAPDLPRDFPSASALGPPSPTLLAILAGAHLRVRGHDGADLVLGLRASSREIPLRAPLDLVEPVD